MAYSRGMSLTVQREGVIPLENVDELLEELFRGTKRQWTRVISGSLSPTIQPDDRVLIEHVEPKQVRLGDVIVFRTHDRWTAHRVLGKRLYQGKLAFLEKGDLESSLGLVSAGRVLGRVSAVERDGRVLNLLSGPSRAVQLALALCGVWDLHSERWRNHPS